jgi:type II secretory pathway component PulK
MKDRKERGVILPMIIGLLAIMGIIATFLIYRAETEWAALVNLEKNGTTRELAEQTLYEHLTLLLRDETEDDYPEEEWFGATGRFVSERDGYEITVLIEDEGSKPNLNLMTDWSLRCLAIPKEQPIAAILDWLDPDQSEREDGAEAPYYNSLDPAYQPRDGFFSSLQELLMVKDGPALYPYVAPELTVYGKLNFNVLTPDQFELILDYAGIDKNTRETMVNEFRSYIKKKTTVSSFIKLVELFNTSKDCCAKLKPFLNFSGSANLNFMSANGLKAQLALASQGKLPNKVTTALLQYRRSKYFKSIGEVKAKLTNLAGGSLNFQPENYFTVNSGLIRYRIWVIKGECKYYLNTVQERSAGDLRHKWKVRTLAWQVLTNKRAPEIPKLTPWEKTSLLWKLDEV